MKKNLFKISLFLVAAAIIFFSGCKKDTNPASSVITHPGSSASIPKGYTMTMVGLIPDSNVILIEPGYKVSFINGHAYKVHIASGVRVKDLGAVMPNFANKNVPSNLTAPRSKFLNPPSAHSIFGNSGQNSNWITYSEWQTANPVTNFTTTWTVPNAPTSLSGQNFAIWMGLMPTDSTYPQVTGQQLPLIQPLLIWGNSGGAIGGGQYWTIVSYIIWTNAGGQTIAAISSPKHNITPGTVLQAQISSTGQQSDGSYNCVSQFVGQTSLTITENEPMNLNSSSGGTVNAPFIPALNYACEVLEIPGGAPYITSVNEYPNQLEVSMNSISVTTGFGSNATYPTINWESSSANNLPNGAALGEHTNVINGGQVNIYFAPQTVPVISYSSPETYYTGTAIPNLSPTNIGGAATSYTISPALPAGLVFNTTTGVISGTPTAPSPATNYTVTATNASGNGNCTLNITVNVPISFNVSSGNSAITDFMLVVNGVNESGPRGVSHSNPINVVGAGNSTSSTVQMQVTFGYMPVSATLYGPYFSTPGVISGNTITFSNFNLTIANYAYQLVIN